MTKPYASTRSLSAIANDIANDWKSVYFGARPYLTAMFSLQNMGDMYGAESAKSIVLYFLSNATGWRGPQARAIKIELNKMLKNAR